jgi:hypothetical protein
MQTATITLDFGAHTLMGTVTLLGRRALVEVDGLGGSSLTMNAAAGALASAVRDGRCRVPDALRAAIDSGTEVAAALL